MASATSGDLIKLALRRLAMSSALLVPVQRQAMLAVGREEALPVVGRVGSERVKGAMKLDCWDELLCLGWGRCDE